MRMIQGDVGCGKTSVAIILAALMSNKNYQVAYMCPTEALANQHFMTFSDILKDSGLKISLLTGSCCWLWDTSWLQSPPHQI